VAAGAALAVLVGILLINVPLVRAAAVVPFGLAACGAAVAVGWAAALTDRRGAAQRRGGSPTESAARLRDRAAGKPRPESPAGNAGGERCAGPEGTTIGITTRRGQRVCETLEEAIIRSSDDLGTRLIARHCGTETAAASALGFSAQPDRRFFADAPVGIAVVDRGGRFVEVNRALGELFGATPQALIGHELIGFLAEEDRAAIVAKFGAAATVGTIDREPVEIRLAQPRDRTMVLLLSRIDEFGAVATDARTVALEHIGMPDNPEGRLTLYFIDVTEQKHLEAQFVQSQKMQAVGQLAGGVAHDFNNLLTAMIGFCDLLLLRSRPSDPAFADIMQIKQNANRAANLVRQLLAFSRQQTLQPRVLDITDILVELSHLLRRLIGENITLEVEHGRELGLVKVDQGQLEQVVINLVVNARDAMPQGGRLTIRTANAPQAAAVRRGAEVMPAGDYVLIEVADTGVGIAPDNLARIFEPFFSTKEVGSGTGLGLSTVYGIVKQTGGFVFVESVQGCGAAFEIYLPRHQAAATPALRKSGSEPSAPRDLTGSAAVMLVEDDEAVRMFGARAAQQGLPRQRSEKRRGRARTDRRREREIRSADHRCRDAADGRAGADPRSAPSRPWHQGHLYLWLHRGYVPAAARQRQQYSFSGQAVQLEATRP
jgi:two-component system, cell cycle sensor histidine kinase and response regulator CckA